MLSVETPQFASKTSVDRVIAPPETVLPLSGISLPQYGFVWSIMNCHETGDAIFNPVISLAESSVQVIQTFVGQSEGGVNRSVSLEYVSCEPI